MKPISLNITRVNNTLRFGNRQRDAKIPPKRPFIVDGAHQKWERDRTGKFEWVPRDFDHIGQLVLARPWDYHMESVPTLGAELPFYVLVRINKKREVCHYIFGRGLQFDVLYMCWLALR
jgi:hypothetical protein